MWWCFFFKIQINRFIDTPLFLGEIDTAEERLNESRTNKFRDIRGLVSD